MSNRIWDGDTCLSALQPVDFGFCCGGSCDMLGRCVVEVEMEDGEEKWRSGRYG